MEQTLLAYGVPKEIVTAIMMFYKNMKVKVHSLDGDLDFFDMSTLIRIGITIIFIITIIIIVFIIIIIISFQFFPPVFTCVL